MMFEGLLSLPWWGVALVCLVMVQITIASVTIYLHRCQAHRALDVHPAVAHFFRFWLWLTTGMVTKEWAAIHRKHHAKCETEDDPHSPRIHGINKILFTGVAMYVRESRNGDTMTRYGHGTPDDWMERNLYTPLTKYGIMFMAVVDVLLFGGVPGMIVFGIQAAWIPFWAAGVINGIGHFWGYRNFQTGDDSTNIVPWAVWIGGEELHNNHHAYPTSAKFSLRWYEFDLGWLYIRGLSALGLAKVRKTAPKVKLDPSKWEIDAATLQAVIMHRYDVMTNYAKSIKRAARMEIVALREKGMDGTATTLKNVRKFLHLDDAVVPQHHRETISQVVDSTPALKTTLTMKQELARLWERSTLSTEQLVAQLRDWCERAEKTNVEPLVQFARRLRCYA